MQISDITSEGDNRVTTPLREYKNILGELHPWVSLKVTKGQNSSGGSDNEGGSQAADNSLQDKINKLKSLFGHNN
jgi:hypothetical protein